MAKFLKRISWGHLPVKDKEERTRGAGEGEERQMKGKWRRERLTWQAGLFMKIIRASEKPKSALGKPHGVKRHLKGQTVVLKKGVMS